MPKLLEIFKCEHCGNIVEIIHAGGAPLSCCGTPMKQLAENTVDASKEKHVPVVEVSDGVVKVTVGSVLHPMEPQHFIEWIELIADGTVFRQALQPGDVPTATFAVTASTFSVRELCNLHGLWAA